jgi:hypothetical protein
MQVMIPAGFMVEDGPKGASLVVCTGHGPLIVDQASMHHAPGRSDKAPTSRPDSPCAFAGHGATPTPAPLLALLAAPTAVTPALAQPLKAVAPARTLAAPPPPSQGPPSAI